MNRGKKPNLITVSKGSPESEPLGPPPTSWSAGQAALWREVTGAIPSRLTTRSDRLLVELACRLLAEVRAAAEVKTATYVELRRLLGELGLTPAERLRLSREIPPEPEANRFAEIFGEGGAV